MGKTEQKTIFFPPEWHDQDGVMLTWPHEHTDWALILPEVEQTYLDLAREILKREELVVVCHSKEEVSARFSPVEREKIRFYQLPSDDTWSRDHGPLSVYIDGKPAIYDFTFNGWGGKFFSGNDNNITKRLFEGNAFSRNTSHIVREWVLEGGSVETDGQGTILTTSACLLNPNRNGVISLIQAEHILKENLGAKRILWLDHGHLEGDDTDSHIDTLARFCDRTTICYVSCTDENDPHFLPLKKMEQQLQGFRTTDGEPYRLVALPMVSPMYNEEGNRLPATYANFLIINQAVLLPVYHTKEDREAVRILKALFPDRELVEIDCSVLIQQNGSLHCVTMQIPKGFLS